MNAKDNSFDIIICNDSFHHYPDPGKALSVLTAGAGFSGIQYEKTGNRAFIMTARKHGTRNMDPEQFYKEFE